MSEIKFQIVDRPDESKGRNGKWTGVRNALLALPDGKSVALPSGTFGVGDLGAHGTLSMGRYTPRKLRIRHEDGLIKLWLEPPASTATDHPVARLPTYPEGMTVLEMAASQKIGTAFGRHA